MSKLIPGNGCHLTLQDRMYIEEALDEKKSFREIARYLCKDPSTISKEVWNNRVVNLYHRGSFINPHNFCIHRFNCKKQNVCQKIVICDTYCKSCLRCNKTCQHFVKECCKQIEHAPYVCNGCTKPRNRCSIQTKYDYRAKAADRLYRERLVDSRSGIDLSKKQVRELESIVQPLIMQGQSPYMIIANHPELNISVKTLYNYIEQGVLLVRNVDLKRKVKFKPRKCHKTQITDREVFIGRTYQDFIDAHAYESEYWQMDTVKSARGSLKCILTIYNPKYELLIARLMNRCTPSAVKAEFEALQKMLGDEVEFSCLFESILTDRGVEFGKPQDLEACTPDFARTAIFYCDPMRSCQKAGIENVHTMLRMILPKGTVFEDLTQWDVRKCADHINNAPRKKLNGSTPYELALKHLGENMIKKLQLRYIAPDEVTLSPKLLNRN